MKWIIGILVLLVIGVVGYIVWFQPSWFSTLVDRGEKIAKGFTPAKTPKEAMEKFTEAIKKRDYKSASEYCTGDYAEALQKAHEEARALGETIDTVTNLMKEKGLTNDKAKYLLRQLDPFPHDFKVEKVDEPKDGKVTGHFAPIPINLDRSELGPTPLAQMDPKMFQTNLMPTNELMFNVPLKEVGEGDAKSWKLDIPLKPEMRAKIDYYTDHARTYVTALEDIAVRLRQSGGISTKDELVEELTSALRDAGK